MPQQNTPARAASGAPPVSGAYRVDISRGERIGRVSSEWFSRPDDERYLSLTELHKAVRARADRATARTVETRALRIEASRDNAERLTLAVPGRDEPVAPTHWSYGQLCSLVGAPASYMRQLPAPLAGINLQHGLLSHRAELVKTLEADDGRVELRAVTGPDYGRIWDHELVEGRHAHRRRRHGRHPVEGAGPARLGDHDAQPLRGGREGHHHSLRVGPGRFPVLGRRRSSDRGRDGCRMEIPTSTFGVSTAGTARLAPRRSASPSSISVRSA